MTTRNLHVIAIDPGHESGFARFTVPRRCIFGDEASRIVEWDYGIFSGPEPEQALDIARLVREVQSLDYGTGPALVVEDWDQDPSFKSTDPEALSPVRIGAMLTMLMYETEHARVVKGSKCVQWMGDATLHFQGRTQAKQAVTDERLRRWGLWVKGPDHQRDAIRHGITAIRRARENPEFARELWPR